VIAKTRYFSQAMKSIIRPRRLGSSGTWAMPRAAPGFGTFECLPVRSIGSPFHTISRALWRCRRRHFRSSDWPIAATPAMPRISRAHGETTRFLNRFDAVPHRDAQVLEPQATVSPDSQGAFYRAQRTLRPTITSASLAGWRGSAVFTVAVISPRRNNRYGCRSLSIDLRAAYG